MGYHVKLADGRSVRYVNLDNAATTPPFRGVEVELSRELTEYGSVHRGSGRKSKISTARYEAARETVRSFLNARPTDYVIFAQNTTTGMNQLAYLFAQVRGRVLVSDMEHSSSWLPWVFHEGRYRTNSRVTLQQALGGKTAELNRGVMETGMDSVLIYKTREDFSFDPADIERVFRQSSKSCEDGRVKAIVATAASNVTGYRPPLKKIAEIAHRYKAMLVVDACQLLQHERLDMQESGADFAVFSGHKMYAPFGCGVVVGDRRLFDAFWPYQMGGGNFPYITADGEVMRLKNNAAHEAGTPNFLGARAIHRAIDQLTEIGMAKIASYERLLVKYAFDELSRTAEITIYSNNFRTGEFDGSVITFNVGSLPPRLVAEVLDSEYGIGVRAGAYCAYEFARRINKVDAGEDREISRQVAAGNTSAVPGSVRASFSLVNSKEDVDRLVAALKEISKRALKQYKMMYAMDKRTGEWKGISR